MVTAMKSVDLDFVCRVLAVFNGFNSLSNEDLWWRTDGEYAPVTLFVNCNDLFYWGVADAEDVTPDNVELLERAVKDVVALTKSNRHADAVFCCWVRGMRPQGACYNDYPKTLWPLFDAAGPEREVGGGNPKPRPKDEDGGPRSLESVTWSR